jgi:hypothetical protein
MSYNVKYFIILITMLLLQIEVHSEETFKDKVKKYIFDETEDPLFKKHRLEVESGAVHILHNNIGTNSSTGSLFNTTNIENQINFYARFSYYFNLDRKNSFKLMVAPLSVNGEGTLSNSFEYGNKNFIPAHTSYKYKFNSYRATYRRTIFENKDITFRLGLTIKIRDAFISLSQENSQYKKSNIGVIPLMHLNFEYRPIKKWAIITEVDLAAAPQGRAIDFAVSGRYDVNEYLDVAIGYRFLEGGAQNSKVYNMAFINYYFLALGMKF